MKTNFIDQVSFQFYNESNGSKFFLFPRLKNNSLSFQVVSRVDVEAEVGGGGGGGGGGWGAWRTPCIKIRYRFPVRHAMY